MVTRVTLVSIRCSVYRHTVGRVKGSRIMMQAPFGGHVGVEDAGGRFLRPACESAASFRHVVTTTAHAPQTW